MFYKKRLYWKPDIKFSIMGALRQQLIVDKQGKPFAVLIPIDQYNKILEQLEEIA